MSVKIMGLVWDYEIPRDEKFVLLAYADHASHDGTNVYPSVATIARKTGYSERSVQIITRKLQKMELLIPDGKGVKGTNKWRIPLVWGAISAPANSAGVQNGSEGGAKPKEEGVQPTAPEPSEPPSSEPSVKKRKAATPSTPTPPEIQLYREVVKRYPSKEVYGVVVSSIQRISARLLRPCIATDLQPYFDKWLTKSNN